MGMNVFQEKSINMDSRKVMSPQLLARLFFRSEPRPPKEDTTRNVQDTWSSTAQVDPKSAMQDWDRFVDLFCTSKSLRSLVIYVVSWGLNPVVTGSPTRITPDTKYESTAQCGGWMCAMSNRIRSNCLKSHRLWCCGLLRCRLCSLDCDLVFLFFVVVDQSYLQIKQPSMSKEFAWKRVGNLWCWNALPRYDWYVR